MAPFEKPVSLEAYPDYMQYVQTPMDLQTIEKKVNSDSYETPEDFEYDCMLVFKNCEAYNAARKGEHLVAMAKFGAKQFRRIFPVRMKSFEDPSSTVDEQGGGTGGDGKKVKAEAGAGIAKMRAVPRISITAAQVSSAQAQAAKTTKSTTVPSLKIRAPPAKANQPVPLHIAIARVKVRKWGELLDQR